MIFDIIFRKNLLSIHSIVSDVTGDVSYHRYVGDNIYTNGEITDACVLVSY